MLYFSTNIYFLNKKINYKQTTALQVYVYVYAYDLSLFHSYPITHKNTYTWILLNTFIHRSLDWYH